MHWELWLQAHHMTKLSSSNNPPNSFNRQSKQPFPRGFCWKFHQGERCFGCNFKHVCFKCGGDHPATKCKSRKPTAAASCTALSHPVQLPTPVKVNRLHFYLDGYPTKLKDYLLNGFQLGFLLDYVGPHKIIYPLLKTLQPFPINCQKN